ncbi:entericidin A [Serratia fonticola]|nr:entericidin A [Serratia fonticola]CAI1061790.1 entericidin A [Serratia fonticola]CAI1075048.1 entericidin A [Serratia fonticola]CAI1671019.1 entericidin A [Serratia fonticola]CAI1686020.1 entericidin A [Serratia fonticola]
MLSLPVTRWQNCMMKKTLLAVVSLLLLMSLSGCNTFRGFGEDVQHLGGAISRSAG